MLSSVQHSYLFFVPPRPHKQIFQHRCFFFRQFVPRHFQLFREVIKQLIHQNLLRFLFLVFRRFRPYFSLIILQVFPDHICDGIIRHIIEITCMRGTDGTHHIRYDTPLLPRHPWERSVAEGTDRSVRLSGQQGPAGVMTQQVTFDQVSEIGANPHG